MRSHSFRSRANPQETSHAEIMVIWAFRLWVGDRRNWPSLVGEIIQRYGQDRGASVIRALAMTISALRQHACRVIRHHPDGFPTLTPDEELLLAMIADATAGRDPAARACGLIHHTGRMALRAAVCELARALHPFDSSISKLAAAE